MDVDYQRVLSLRTEKFRTAGEQESSADVMVRSSLRILYLAFYDMGLRIVEQRRLVSSTLDIMWPLQPDGSKRKQ